MANAIISQTVVETVINPTDQQTIVSQAIIEAVVSPTDQVMTISQMVLEVLTPFPQNRRRFAQQF